MAVHARQLAFKPNLQIIRRSRRTLLCGVEQARQSALANHVHRIAPMGAPVLINGTRYNAPGLRFFSASTVVALAGRQDAEPERRTRQVLIELYGAETNVQSKLKQVQRAL